VDRTIETERFTLRVPVATDLSAMATLWKDPELVKFIGRKPLSREQAWQRLQRIVGHWALAGYGVFAVTERASGRYIGEVGIANFERDIVPPIGRFEMGWIISPLVQGRGYASEAVRAVLAAHDRHYPARSRAVRFTPITPRRCEWPQRQGSSKERARPMVRTRP
jgi:RimJ/RimL family protein N-acetyltransferase